ncbi:unnamed protein product [Ceratitis capitata]|uniref:(Mediterranean fruit fly) hypothetical protein n=1 Tax=Ceratitis capitata TaxID=7213 RepID=A0A811ULN8_CERCA|nr:unnamed protein product [Ceratitis capitata]
MHRQFGSYSHHTRRTHQQDGPVHRGRALTNVNHHQYYAPNPGQKLHFQDLHMHLHNLSRHALQNKWVANKRSESTKINKSQNVKAKQLPELKVTKILLHLQREQKLKLAEERLEKEKEQTRLHEERERAVQHQNQVDVEQQNKLNLSEAEFVQHLSRYIMEVNLQRLHGYPTESAREEGTTEIYKHFDYLGARSSKLYNKHLDGEQFMEKQCIRCERTFHLTYSGEYISTETCTFHWGKLYDSKKGDNLKEYTCCAGGKDSAGCAHNAFHVWTGIEMGVNGPYDDFVYTQPRTDAQSTNVASKVYSLDCEMVFTGRGLEVARVTVVGWNDQLIYDHFVQPIGAVVDYNTRFSGITADDLNRKENKYLKSFREVQKDLLQLIKADTILIGHGLENDLRVLRMVHKRIVDTSYEFPHHLGFPYRCSLKSLSKKYLKRDIQVGDVGHSSMEDSIACMELMKWKVREFVKSQKNDGDV